MFHVEHTWAAWPNTSHVSRGTYRGELVLCPGCFTWNIPLPCYLDLQNTVGDRCLLGTIPGDLGQYSKCFTWNMQGLIDLRHKCFTWNIPLPCYLDLQNTVGDRCLLGTKRGGLAPSIKRFTWNMQGRIGPMDQMFHVEHTGRLRPVHQI